jgi:hypothetical protein
MTASHSPAPPWPTGFQRFRAGARRFFHTYASWLVSISWKRFIVLAVLLMIAVSIIEELPPFRWRVTELVTDSRGPRASRPSREPVVKIERTRPAASAPDGMDISIDERGIRISPRKGAADAASGPAAPSTPASAVGAAGADLSLPEVIVKLPPGASEEVRQAIEEARRDVAQALRDAKQAVAEATADAREAANDLHIGGPRWRTRTIHFVDFLSDLAFIWIVASAIIKFTYKGRLQAEAQAAVATEVAESEQLKRQVVEARMAAMQAQVEPHFLFNTLASIDHLIETDPPRASQMQKHLIALLRASMPTMRETGNGGLRDLGRELAVIKPYLEILKVRMEERLQPRIEVPEGLHSAAFPPMMIQTLVENAIKHGLEPKSEGGSIVVRAEIVHGKLAVTVADTGLGFGKAATAGTGVGLANIRERLKLLYGNKASLAVTENRPEGTLVTITVPYEARPSEEGESL